ncbi:MAG: DUF2058 domain-containing protein [Methylococcaceae bacterium]
MGNALRDQLLKSGLVNEKQAKKAQQEKRKESRQIQNKPATPDVHRAEREAAVLAKAERDRVLNREKQKEQDQKAQLAQIRQLIEAHRIPRENGEIRFNFQDSGKVKSLYVTEEARSRLVRGRLGIVRLDGHYELVEAEAAVKIAQRDNAAVVLLNFAQNTLVEKDQDDPYAAYTVPDDLVW